jgi:hypothetical protein
VCVLLIRLFVCVSLIPPERQNQLRNEEEHKHLAEVFGINLDVDPPMREATLSETEAMEEGGDSDGDGSVKPKSRKKPAAKAAKAPAKPRATKAAAKAKAKPPAKPRGRGKKKEETSEDEDEDMDERKEEIEDSDADGGQWRSNIVARTSRLECAIIRIVPSFFFFARMGRGCLLFLSCEVASQEGDRGRRRRRDARSR